jgi:hypothetical protein
VRIGRVLKRVSLLVGSGVFKVMLACDVSQLSPILPSYAMFDSGIADSLLKSVASQEEFLNWPFWL